MKKQFTVNIPDEPWINVFSQGKTMTLEYDGPDEFTVLRNKETGLVVIHNDMDSPYNQNLYNVEKYKADDHIEAAYFLTANAVNHGERKSITITNVDGSKHDEVDPTEFTIFDYYILEGYNAETNKFNLNLLTRPKQSALYWKAEENKQYILNHANAFTTDTLNKTANTYINILNNYQTSGNGSIYSWRLSSINIADVPVVPPNLIDAVLLYLSNTSTSNT